MLEGVMDRVRSRRLKVGCGATAMIGAGVLAAATSVLLGAGPATADSCSQYIQPGNPYVNTCGISSQRPAAIGGSPSAGAIIACRNIPGCLSYAVNGPGLVRVPQVDTTVRQSP
jgi:hypothetical protein